MPMYEFPSKEAPLTLRISSLTGEQHDWLCRAGCTCVPIPHVVVGHPYQVTFPSGTCRKAVPRPLDQKRVNRDFLITLPNGRNIDEIHIPGHESVLFLTRAMGRASADRAPQTTARRRP